MVLMEVQGGMPTQFMGEVVLSSGLDGVDRFLKSGCDIRSLDIKDAIKPPPIKRKLRCSLEELYNGSTRKVNITRHIPDENGRTGRVEEVLQINIKPGWSNGTQMSFVEKGSRKVGMMAPDIIFEVEEKPHGTFKREGNDLVAVVKVALVDALTGYAATIPTLDGRVLTIPCAHIVRPGSEVVVHGEGMPIPEGYPPLTHDQNHNHNHNHDHNHNQPYLIREDQKHGDLRLHFDILFPSTLSALQKTAIRQALT